MLKNLNMKKDKLPKGMYIFEWGGLMENAGGMTRAMLKRADAFIQEGIEVKILLSARGMEQRNAIEHYRVNGYPNIRKDNFITMEEYYGELLANPEILHEVSQLNKLDQLPKEERNGKTFYYDMGEVFAIEKSNDILNKREVAFLDSSGLEIKKEIYWEKRLSRIVIKNVNKNDKREQQSERFFAKNGFCFLSIVSEFDGKNWNAVSLNLYSEYDRNVRKFQTLDEFRQMFFLSFVKECKEKDIFIFCDPILDFQPGYQYMNDLDKNIYRIAINHGVGFGGERCWYSEINPRLRDLIERANPPQMEALILLTKEACADFQMRLGNRTIFYQLPNTVFIPDNIADFDERDLKSIVYVGRFDEKQKQITHIIRAFSKVIKDRPGVTLHLYGRGDGYPVLEKLVSELQLINNVVFEGFTNSVSEIYQKAAFSVCSSEFEGFSLSLLESFANGCPVVTYDFKYGPRDCIDDGVSGYIVEKNNIDELADKMILLLNNPERIRIMSSNARSTIQNYHESHYLDNWKNVLRTVVEKKSYQTILKDLRFNLTEVQYSYKNQDISVEGFLQIEGSVPNISKGREHIYIRIYELDEKSFTICEPQKCYEMYDMKYQLSFNVPLKDKNQKISICVDWENSFLSQSIQFY